MSYLEDTGKEETRLVLCDECIVEDEQEGTHYLDSETFRWECSHCMAFNEVPMAAEGPDPDEAHDREVEDRLFGD